MDTIMKIAQAAQAQQGNTLPAQPTTGQPLANWIQMANFNAHKGYQANIRRSESLRKDILKQAAAGADTRILLLLACECIGTMTGDRAFHGMVQRRLEEREAPP